MNNGKKKNKGGDNTWLLVLLGVLGVGGTVGAIAWARSKSDNAGTNSNSNSGSSAGAIGTTLPEVAGAIRQETLIVDGCTVSWRVGEASRTELLRHRDDFFVPAIADARAKGAVTVDEITAHLAGLLVPGCAWPPTVLQEFNLDDAVNGRLNVFQKQAWTIAQSSGAVRLYLTLRQVVAVLATQNRRG